MAALLAHLPIATIILAAAAGLKGLWDAILALRAKTRARTLLSGKLSTDRILQRTIGRTDHDGAKIDATAAALVHALGDLSPRDLERVRQGLQQTSKSGELRYINTLTAGTKGS